MTMKIELFLEANDRIDESKKNRPLTPEPTPKPKLDK